MAGGGRRRERAGAAPRARAASSSRAPKTCARAAASGSSDSRSAPATGPTTCSSAAAYPVEPGLAAARARLEGAARARDRGDARRSAECRWWCRSRRASGGAAAGWSSASCWRRCSRARVDLRRLWGARSRRGERRRLAASLGEIVRRAHAAGLHQDDLAPNNVLVERRAERRAPRLVDFERARLRAPRERARPPPHAREARARGRRACPLPSACASCAPTRATRAGAPLVGAPARRGAPARAPGRHAHASRAHARRAALPRDRARRLARLSRGASARARAGASPRLRSAGRGRRLASRRRPEPGAWSIRAAPRASARRLWARANTLAARGLAPVPLALLRDRERTLLIVDARRRRAPAGRARPRRRGERRAAARLLARLAGLGELRRRASLPEALACWSRARGPPARPARRAARLPLRRARRRPPQPRDRRPPARRPRAPAGRLVRPLGVR